MAETKVNTNVPNLPLLTTRHKQLAVAAVGVYMKSLERNIRAQQDKGATEVAAAFEKQLQEMREVEAAIRASY